MTANEELTQILLDWSTVFVQRSLCDFMRYTRSTGLSLPQINVLMRLYYQGACPVTGLADTLFGSRAGASQMVDRMVRLGLVERVEMPHDRRARQVNLTDRGRVVVAESIQARQEWMAALMADLSPAEKDAIAASLTVLTNAARQWVESDGCSQQMASTVDLRSKEETYG